MSALLIRRTRKPPKAHGVYMYWVAPCWSSSTTDHVKDAGEALRARGDVSPDALVTIYSPSTNVCWSGPLKEM